MKQLVFTTWLVLVSIGVSYAQQSNDYKSYKTQKLEANFELDDLYTEAQIARLEVEHPEKLASIKSFFTTWDDLNPATTAQLVKIDMYRLYIRDREAFDNQLSELSN